MFSPYLTLGLVIGFADNRFFHFSFPPSLLRLPSHCILFMVFYPFIIEFNILFVYLVIVLTLLVIRMEAIIYLSITLMIQEHVMVLIWQILLMLDGIPMEILLVS